MSVATPAAGLVDPPLVEAKRRATTKQPKHSSAPRTLYGVAIAPPENVATMWFERVATFIDPVVIGTKTARPYDVAKSMRGCGGIGRLGRHFPVGD